MRNLIILLIVLLLGVLGVVLFKQFGVKPQTQVISQQNSSKPESSSNPSEIDILVVAENLDTPWGLAFLPDPPGGEAGKTILVTERKGVVRIINPDGKLNSQMISIDGVKEVGEGGLLGIAVDPDFSNNHFVYLYFTYEDSGRTFNKVVRFEYSEIGLAVMCPPNNPDCNAKTPRLQMSKVIVDKIPSSSNHNGGRIKFGPDKALYISTGDAENPPQAQDKNTYGGKILKVDQNGKIEVYSYGHRNVQGLAWDNNGNFWATEHGRSGIQSGLDEINKIEKGKNYGWPTIQGDDKKDGMETPTINSGSNTWAPAGIAFYNNSLFFGGLRGQTLYEAKITGDSLQLKEHFKGEFGRIRDVVLGPDNMLYITTSNKDGRGIPKEGDDKIIKINPLKL